MSGGLSVLAPDGVGEVTEGSDLAALFVEALETSTAGPLQDGDVVLVTSKVVSKAEGRSRRGDRDTAQQIAHGFGSHPAPPDLFLTLNAASARLPQPSPHGTDMKLPLYMTGAFPHIAGSGGPRRSHACAANAGLG